MQCCQAPGNEDRRTLTSLLQCECAARLEWGTEWGDGLLEIPDAAAAEAATCCLQKSLLVVGCLAEDQNNESRASSLHVLGHLHIFAKDFGEAICCLEEALRTKRSVYGDQDAASVAETLGLLGQATFHTGKLDRAIHFLIQSLDMHFSIRLDDSDEPLSLRRQWDEECIGPLRKCVLMLQSVHFNPSALEQKLGMLFWELNCCGLLDDMTATGMFYHFVLYIPNPALCALPGLNDAWSECNLPLRPIGIR